MKFIKFIAYFVLFYIIFHYYVIYFHRFSVASYGVAGEVYAIYVLKEYQNQNIGRNLMKYSIEKLSKMGLISFLVWVLESNPYKQFYEKLGGTQIDRKPLDSSDGSPFLIAYAWKDGKYCIIMHGDV